MKAFILALLCAWVISAPAFAETSPQAFLATILQHDFDGDGAFRIGKAIFTAGPCSKAGDPSCTEAREYFNAKDDPTELVVKWEFAGAEITTAKDVMLPIHFVAVAEAIGHGDSVHNNRRVKPLAAPRDVTVTYHLKRRSEDWVLVNPPLPRVALSALIRIVQDEIQQLEETMNREVGDPRIFASHKKYRDMEAAELAEVEALAERVNIPPESKPGEADKTR